VHVLMPTLGSSGDVNPFIALGLTLRARGHRATILTNPLFQPLIEAQGLGFLPVGRIEDIGSFIADPNLWHMRKGIEVVTRRMIVPTFAEVYRLIETHSDADTVVAASSISLGARIAQEKLGIPTASVHLQPIVIRSLIDQGTFGNVRLSASQPMWLKEAFFRFADWFAIDRIVKQPLNEFRAKLALPPVHRILQRWIHSPECVLAFFPEWFAPRQPDWPPHTHLVGFPLWDGGGSAALPPEVGEFLADGPPPIVFTPGSAASTLQSFFLASIEAVSELGARAMLITNFPDQLPRELPRGVKAFGYVPFSDVLPKTALIVYHGGIGTLAQAVKSGIPHLVVPNAHDQFDNAWRIEQRGLGRSISQGRYRAGRAAREMAAILGDRTMKERCLADAARIDSQSALRRACELIEGLAGKALPRRSDGARADRPRAALDSPRALDSPQA
jgi:rhamnosyltransferase subunit B